MSASRATVCLVRRGEIAPVSKAPPDGERTLHSKQSAAILQHAIRALRRGVLREAFGEAETQLQIAAKQTLPLDTVKSGGCELLLSWDTPAHQPAWSVDARDEKDSSPLT